MSALRFAELVRDDRAPLEDLALAIAGEFVPVAASVAHARLDLLAAGCAGIVDLAPAQRARALVDLIGNREHFECERGRDPSSLMLHRVLERRAGHPLALSVVYASVARRAGFELHPIGDRTVCMLADIQAEPALAIDPVPNGRSLPNPARWLCPHLVALMLINAIGNRYIARGNLGGAIRAAELRLLLPLADEALERHRTELASLRALLN